jgi:hypothetical protein
MTLNFDSSWSCVIRSFTTQKYYLYIFIKLGSPAMSAGANPMNVWPIWLSCMDKCILLLVLRFQCRYRSQHKKLQILVLHWAVPKNQCSGGIRTRIFYSWGGCDYHCSMPPGLIEAFFVCKCYRIEYIYNRRNLINLSPETSCVSTANQITESEKQTALWIF